MKYGSSIVRSLALWAVFAAAAGTWASAQSSDPAELMNRSARTRVSTRRPVQKPVMAAAITQVPVARRLAPLTPAITQPAPMVSKPAVKSALEPAASPVGGSGVSLILVSVAVVAAFAGTIVLLAFVNRWLQQRIRPVQRPSVIAPIPFAPAPPEVHSLPPAPEEDDRSDALEYAKRYQRGRGEMELAMAIERLKKELPAPRATRKAAVPKTRNGRIAAARKLGMGSGEMDLALRLDQLRAASRTMEGLE